MLSLAKLALVAVVVLAVAAFARQARAHRARAAARRAPTRGKAVADLVRCPRCGVHHAADDGHVCDESTRRKS